MAGGAAAYRAGAAFENEVINVLEKGGRCVCVRSAASKSPVDIVVFDLISNPYVIQCKLRGDISIMEWNILHKFSLSYDTEVFLVWKEDGNIRSWKIEEEYNPSTMSPRIRSREGYTWKVSK